MIDTLLDVLFFLVKGVIGLLPEWHPGHLDALRNVGMALRTFDQYFPMTTMFQIISVWLAFYVSIYIVRPLISFVQLR